MLCLVAWFKRRSLLGYLKSALAKGYDALSASRRARIQRREDALVDRVVAAGKKHLPEIMRRRTGGGASDADRESREGFEATMRGLVDVMEADRKPAVSVILRWETPNFGRSWRN